MARPKLSSPEQPLWIRGVLRIYEFLASLKLAVFLIFSVAFVLAWATFVESVNGTRAVHFGIYGTWWFAALQMLLAVNIFCAAAIRYPWKRYQTGFVITHVGLLTLLFGCWLSRQYGIDAQMLIPEGSDSSIAFEDRQHFEISIHRGHTRPNSAADAEAGSATAEHAQNDQVEVISIPFRGGPFNWEDYAQRPFVPWQLARRDRGVLFDEDGIRLEVVDYYADSKVVDAPWVRLELSMPSMPGRSRGSEGKKGDDPDNQAGSGEDDEEANNWMPIELSIRPARDAQRTGYRFGLGSNQRVGGGQISFWMTGTAAATAAFLDSAPTKPLGEKGQVVLHADGQRFTINVAEKLGQPPFALGNTDLMVQVADYFELPDQPEPNRAGVELRITSVAETESNAGDGDDVERLILLAGLPELNRQDFVHGVYGTYWISTGEQKSEDLLRGQGGSRIDVVQGHDRKLYYRYWNRRELVFAKELPTDGSAVDAFRMPIGQLKLRVADHIVRDRPGAEILPAPFRKDATAVDSFRAARVRLTVDGKTDEFWLLGAPPDLLGGNPSPLEHHMLVGNDRVVTVAMPLDVVDIGFRIRLEPGGFERFLDPGTSQAAHYGSVVDFLDRDSDKVLRRGVKISMNAPVDFTDPKRGRSYRLFQEAFRGPFQRGDGIFRRIEQMAGGRLAADRAYVTILTVNYDPGRGTKYLGCALVVAGIAVMFYMRAYFFKPKGKVAATKKQARARSAGAEAELVQS